MLKIAMIFIFVMMVCSLVLFGLKTVGTIQAQSSDLSEPSENLSQGLADLLPDIEKIYQESLTLPFQKAESKIYDEDIAQFYHELLDRSGLGNSADGTN
jgi:predicted PurR-regulated permease PerM